MPIEITKIDIQPETFYDEETDETFELPARIALSGECDVHKVGAYVPINASWAYDDPKTMKLLTNRLLYYMRQEGCTCVDNHPDYVPPVVDAER